MALFEYKALDASGKQIKGIIEADTAKTAKTRLKKNNLYLTEIHERTANSKKTSSATSGLFNRVKIGDISLSTRQLASLVRANIPLVDALSALIEQTEQPRLKVVFSTVRQDVNEGSSLAKAFSKHPKIFTHIYVNMIEAGESSGTLPLVLLRLAEFQESQVRLRAKVSSALTYPALMMLVTFALLIGIFTFVVPKFVTVFESMGKPMPIQTIIVLRISEIITSYWWLLSGASALGILSFLRYINSTKGRRRWDAFKLRMPVFGPVIRMLAVSRFANTLATLLTGGVPILTAMNIVKNVVGNTLISEAVSNARENVTEGQSIAEPLKRSRQFPPLMIHMVAIGEKTGELPDMLKNVASTYEEQVSVKIEGLTALLEPAMIIIMGGVVGGIVAAIFVPLMELNNIS